MFMKLSNRTLDVVADFEKPRFGRDLMNINIQGCFNGIICLRDIRDGILLWNPATKEFKIPPICPVEYPPGYESGIDAIGFGYDSKRDDYKIVRIDTFWDGDFYYDDRGASRGMRVALCSLSIDSWRNLDGTLGISEILGFGCTSYQVYTDGYFHWWAAVANEGELLLSFDMSNEVFITTPFPDGHFGKNYETSSYLHFFMEVNGSVSGLFCHNDFVTDKCYDVWVLGELGVKNSWTKLLTIGPISVYIPLGVGSNGEFFFLKEVFFSNEVLKGEIIVSYHLSTKETKTILVEGHSVEVAMYAESLVSLSGGSAFNP